jgi:hypothetical protein
MLNATIIALIVPNAAQIITEADHAVANSEICSPLANTIWFDAHRINQGIVLWAVPGAGWVKSLHRKDGVLAVLSCREDGSPVSMMSYNEVEVGFARPTLDQHWQAMSACLARK